MIDNFDPMDPNQEYAFKPTTILPTENGARLIWDIQVVRPKDLEKLQQSYISFSDKDLDVIQDFFNQVDEKPF